MKTGKLKAVRGGLIPSFWVNVTENNPIAPEPTYTSHFYYYSTTRDEKRKAAAYWIFILLEVLTVSGRFMKYVKPGAWRNKTTFLTYCSVT